MTNNLKDSSAPDKNHPWVTEIANEVDRQFSLLPKWKQAEMLEMFSRAGMSETVEPIAEVNWQRVFMMLAKRLREERGIEIPWEWIVRVSAGEHDVPLAAQVEPIANVKLPPSNVDPANYQTYQSNADYWIDLSQTRERQLLTALKEIERLKSATPSIPEERNPMDTHGLIVRWDGEEHGFIARILELDWCSGHGNTREDAIAMAESNLRDHLSEPLTSVDKGEKGSHSLEVPRRKSHP